MHAAQDSSMMIMQYYVQLKYSIKNIAILDLPCVFSIDAFIRKQFYLEIGREILHSLIALDHSPYDVCFNQRIRHAIPHRSIFRPKVHQGQVLKSEDKDAIFQLAKNSDEFYRTIVKLQVLIENNVTKIVVR